MQSDIGHVVFSVDPANMAFYKDLLAFLGWQVLVDDPAMLGMSSKGGPSLWFGAATKQVRNDYDGPGMNHLALSVPDQADVDAAASYLKGKGVAHLFETPRHRHDFMPEPETYYQVMFESPDRILFEIVYTGPKR
jgi:catechol 2,3-dioxygenase-like lactoylglutathione lyase family enzyme